MKPRPYSLIHELPPDAGCSSMKTNQKEIVKRLESLSLDEARERIASGEFGGYGGDNHSFALAWISAKEAELRDKRDSDLILLAKRTLRIAIATLIIATMTLIAAIMTINNFIPWIIRLLR
jgi:hypothetical protein